MLVVTAGWLLFFWWYVSGHGRGACRKPDGAIYVHHRCRSTRWTWALIAGTFGITGTIAMAFVTARLAHLPREAFAAPMGFLKVWSVDSDLRDRLY